MSTAVPATPVLTVENLQKSFAGFKAVDGVSFAVHAGEMVALIGPNGAGKTTVFNMINGQTAIDGGRVQLDGRDIIGACARSLPALLLPTSQPRDLWRAGVARTFQITATFNSMTVAENVAVALMSRQGLSPSLEPAAQLHREEALALLEGAGMKAAADRICGTLAYGDLKRVELAMALANRPRLLLMDEPTAGMAPRERGELMALVARLASEQRTAVLFTEHDMDIVFGHAARILVINRGKLIAEGAPAEVRSNRQVREVYLGQDDRRNVGAGHQRQGSVAAL